MCMIDGADNFGWIPLGNRYKKARKEHECDECHRTICPEERYHYHVAIYDGDFLTYHICPHCDIACQWLLEACHGYLFQGVLMDIEEHFVCSDDYFLPRLWLGRMVVGMERKWFRKDKARLMPLPVLPEPIQGPREASIWH